MSDWCVCKHHRTFHTGIKTGACRGAMIGWEKISETQKTCKCETFEDDDDG